MTDDATYRAMKQRAIAAEAECERLKDWAKRALWVEQHVKSAKCSWNKDKSIKTITVVFDGRSIFNGSFLSEIIDDELLLAARKVTP